MIFDVLGSSSSGNCIIINEFLMLDCGLTYKSIKEKLKKTKLIFISHCHSDHCKTSTIKQIAFNYPNIKFVVGSKDLVKILIECNVKKANVFALPSNKWFNLGMLNVKLEKLTHDVPNHLIKFKIKDKKGVYIVDTGRIDDISAKNYDLYLIEANYQHELLKEHQRQLDKNLEYDHLHRVEQVHLSYEQANSFLIENMGKNSVYEYIHKSNYNFESEEENV